MAEDRSSVGAYCAVFFTEVLLCPVEHWARSSGCRLAGKIDRTGLRPTQREQLDRLYCWTPAVFVCVRLAPAGMDLHGRAARLFEHNLGDVRRALRERFRVRRARSLDPGCWAGINEQARAARERVCRAWTRRRRGRMRSNG